jgi:hypothetical protein
MSESALTQLWLEKGYAELGRVSSGWGDVPEEYRPHPSTPGSRGGEKEAAHPRV